MAQDVISIFISYAKPDQNRVLPLYDDLVRRGFDVWIDCRNLKPGQNWDFEIKRGLSKANFVVAFISRNSFDRRGYCQRELKIALDKMSEKLVDDIYLIPVLLDNDVEIPEQLKGIQCISAAEPECNERIIDALNYQLKRIGIERTEIQRREEITWVLRVLRESWDGLPGYDVELQYMDFASDRYQQISEISDYTKGWLVGTLFDHRAVKLHQMPDLFNYGQTKFWRTNSYYVYCSEPNIIGKVLSIQHKVQWYGAGAAHPNYFFRTYSFLVDPLTPIKLLSDVFKDTEEALRTIQAEVRRSVYQTLSRAESSPVDPEWIDRGTADWNDFGAFTFGQEGINIFFAPYQVASYADGSHVVQIPYDCFAPLLRTEYAKALLVEHMTPR